MLLSHKDVGAQAQVNAPNVTLHTTLNLIKILLVSQQQKSSYSVKNTESLCTCKIRSRFCPSQISSPMTAVVPATSIYALGSG